MRFKVLTKRATSTHRFGRISAERMIETPRAALPAATTASNLQMATTTPYRATSAGRLRKEIRSYLNGTVMYFNSPRRVLDG